MGTRAPVPPAAAALRGAGTGRRSRPGAMIIPRASTQDVLRLGGLEWARRSSRARRRRRRIRPMRRAVGTILALAVLGGIVFTGLMLISPPVSNAPALARALDRAHHAVPGPQPPARFLAALLVIEDRQYGSQAVAAPVSVAQLVFGRIDGGSGRAMAALYQQLARTLYLNGRSGLVASSEQVLLAIKLKMKYSRRAVLRMYTDVMYFGHGYYGLSAASCGFFGRPPARLSWGQSAMLAAVAWAPALDDPFTHPKNARAGEASVLSQLVADGTLTRAQAGAAYLQPVLTARRVAMARRRPAVRSARCGGR